MLLSGVLGEVDSLLFEGFSTYIADVAVIFLVVVSVVGLFSQAGEGVKHESADDVAEKHIKEGYIDDVIEEASDLELFHGLAYST